MLGVSLAAQFLEPMAHHLKVHGLGTANEIFDGDPSFTQGILVRDPDGHAHALTAK